MENSYGSQQLLRSRNVKKPIQINGIQRKTNRIRQMSKTKKNAILKEKRGIKVSQETRRISAPFSFYPENSDIESSQSSDPGALISLDINPIEVENWKNYVTSELDKVLISASNLDLIGLFERFELIVISSLSLQYFGFLKMALESDENDTNVAIFMNDLTNRHTNVIIFLDILSHMLTNGESKFIEKYIWFLNNIPNTHSGGGKNKKKTITNTVVNITSAQTELPAQVVPPAQTELPVHDELALSIVQQINTLVSAEQPVSSGNSVDTDVITSLRGVQNQLSLPNVAPGINIQDIFEGMPRSEVLEYKRRMLNSLITHRENQFNLDIRERNEQIDRLTSESKSRATLAERESILRAEIIQRESDARIANAATRTAANVAVSVQEARALSSATFRANWGGIIRQLSIATITQLASFSIISTLRFAGTAGVSGVTSGVTGALGYIATPFRWGLSFFSATSTAEIASTIVETSIGEDMLASLTATGPFSKFLLSLSFSTGLSLYIILILVMIISESGSNPLQIIKRISRRSNISPTGTASRGGLRKKRTKTLKMKKRGNKKTKRYQ